MSLRDVVRSIAHNRDVGDPGQPLYPARATGMTGTVRVTGDTALRHSAVWAACRLRADLISSLPLGVSRPVAMPDGGTMQAAVKTVPIVLTQTGGPNVRYREWVYSSQMDLDRYGNAFGLITARDGAGRPQRIDLVPASDVSVTYHGATGGGAVTYKIGHKTYEPLDVWHERQYTVSGLPIGLSPVAYAAMSIAQYQSAQQFAIGWYVGNAVPTGILSNKAKVLAPKEAADAKARFKAAMMGGDLFVTGNDWTFSPLTAVSNDAAWLDSMGATSIDVARFFGVPGDLIDAPAQGGASITYASITQRNLQMLIMHLGPAVGRREEAFTALLTPAPWAVHLDTEALLRMDPAALSLMLGHQIRDRIRTPSEVREFFNLLPQTDDDLAEFVAAFGKGPAALTALDVADKSNP